MSNRSLYGFFYIWLSSSVSKSETAGKEVINSILYSPLELHLTITITFYLYGCRADTVVLHIVFFLELLAVYIINVILEHCNSLDS